MASILVIDDDRAVLGTIKILLERDAYAVETVDNSLAGLRLLESQKFDLLSSIFHARDGWFRDDESRSSNSTANADHRHIWPSARSTSEQEPDFLHMATKLGAVSSLQKPFRPGELLAAVTECLSTGQEDT